MKFEEFEHILKDTISSFEEINKIGFIGVFGSLNLDRDLDFLIIPSAEIKKGEFSKVICQFLEKLEKNIIKRKSRLIAFNYSLFQEEAEYLSKRKKNDVFLHVCSYPDIVPPNEKVIDAYLKIDKYYFGTKENILKIPATNKDYDYFMLFMANCLYSHYPKKLEADKIKNKISKIFKYNNSKIDFKNKSNKQIYFECCDFLDSIAVIQ